jgi:hypothetical protein
LSIRVELPEELLLATQEEPQIFARQVMIYTLGHLYEQGKISSGIGAQVLGCARMEFYRLLSEHGFLVIHYTAEELEEEAPPSAPRALVVPQERMYTAPESDLPSLTVWGANLESPDVRQRPVEECGQPVSQSQQRRTPWSRQPSRTC